jgi:hypothetical protein
VYGDPQEHPQTEAYWGNVNPIGERSCYDEGEGRQPGLYHGLSIGMNRVEMLGLNHMDRVEPGLNHMDLMTWCVGCSRT